MKNDAVYKLAYNQTLEILTALQIGAALPSETQLSSNLGVSRTTTRKVLLELEERGITGKSGATKFILRGPEERDQFPSAQTTATALYVEQRFVAWLRQQGPVPGTLINCLALARQFGVSTTVVREFLQGIEGRGLIQYRPNANWVFRGYTAAFLVELYDVREIFERRAVRHFVRLPPDSPYWAQLRTIGEQHEQMLLNLETQFEDFPAHDHALHTLVFAASHNRFVSEFQRTLKLVFRIYSPTMSKEIYQARAIEHLMYIDALLRLNAREAEAIIADHLGVGLRRMLATLSAFAPKD
jgi:DNA-binding GntR family transcriptional regulator